MREELARKLKLLDVQISRFKKENAQCKKLRVDRETQLKQVHSDREKMREEMQTERDALFAEVEEEKEKIRREKMRRVGEGNCFWELGKKDQLFLLLD